MLISLSEIMNLTGETRTISADIEMEQFSYKGNDCQFVEKKPVTFKLSSVGNRKVHLKAIIDFVLTAPCDRCLEPVEIPFNIEADYLLSFDEEGNATVEDDDESVNYINGYDLDVDSFVSEEVMIGFPMKVLCSDECRGICKCCGANLNNGECGCDRTELDPRMSIIRDIFNQKEV